MRSACARKACDILPDSDGITQYSCVESGGGPVADGEALSCALSVSYNPAVPVRRLGSLLLLAFLVIDLTTPSLPGVFSIAGQPLFIESAVAMSNAAAPPRIAPAHQPQTAQRIDERDNTASYRARPLNRTLRPFTRRPERRYQSRSSGPSSSSPEAH